MLESTRFFQARNHLAVGWSHPSPKYIENGEPPIPIHERVELSRSGVFGRRSALHDGPDRSFLRFSRARSTGCRGIGSAFVRKLDLPDLPDGSVNQRDHSAGCVLYHGRQRRVCRRPADAPQTRPLFFPSVYSPASARPGLTPFPVCCSPIYCSPLVSHISIGRSLIRTPELGGVLENLEYQH
jgi:hypothetical protein